MKTKEKTFFIITVLGIFILFVAAATTWVSVIDTLKERNQDSILIEKAIRTAEQKYRFMDSTITEVK